MKKETAVCVGLLILATGCVHDVPMKPPQERGAPILSYGEAKTAVESMPGHAMTGCLLGSAYTGVDHVRVADSGVDADCRSGSAAPATPVHWEFSTLAPSLIDESAMALGDRWRVLSGGDHGSFWADFGRRADAERFWDALYVLKHNATGDLPAPAESAADTAAFDKAVTFYRNRSVKPDLPENARRFKVQAEAAVREKRYDDAIHLYAKGLAVAPWWPEGHYNRALLLGEAGRKPEAVREMKKYLQLEPSAPDARAAQDKIYEWGG